MLQSSSLIIGHWKLSYIIFLCCWPRMKFCRLYTTNWSCVNRKRLQYKCIYVCVLVNVFIVMQSWKCAYVCVCARMCVIVQSIENDISVLSKPYRMSSLTRMACRSLPLGREWLSKADTRKCSSHSLGFKSEQVIMK